MLKLETSKTYEQKVGDTLFTIGSESPQDSSADMLDALVALMKRELLSPTQAKKDGCV